MINWDMLKPRNIFVIATISIVAFAIYKHFSKGDN